MSRDPVRPSTVRRPRRLPVRAVLVVLVVLAAGGTNVAPEVAAAGAAGMPAARPATTADTPADAAWILAAQMPDGAIATYRDRQFIDPYLASLAVIGLVRAYTVTQDRYALAAAWRWLGWYASHMDGQGVVHNYRIVDGTAVDTGSVDSTDGSSAVFLLAAYETWKATRDRNALTALAPAIAGAVGAIELTQDADGMTWATPTYRVKYLMNEAEAYAGLRAAAEMAKALRDPALAQRATDDGQRMYTGVSSLWNPSTGSYDWALHENGTRVTTDWRQLYPDAMQQVWAVAYGLADPVRAAALMTKFLQLHPNWAQPTATDLIDGTSRPVGYWVPVGWALLRVGNRAAATAGGVSIRAGADATDWAWPWTVADAGELIVLDSGRLPAWLSARPW